jgi:hypothetical protein
MTRMRDDFKTIISKRCFCDGKTVCAWCLKQEEDYYSDNYEPKTHMRELNYEQNDLRRNSKAVSQS